MRWDAALLIGMRMILGPSVRNVIERGHVSSVAIAMRKQNGNVGSPRKTVVSHAGSVDGDS